MIKKLNSVIKWSALAVLPAVAFGITFFGATETGAVMLTENAPCEAEKVLEKESAHEIYNFLILGEDEAAGLTDAMLIVSCDTKRKAVNALQIPRDTYAEYTSAAYRKINAASDVLGGGEAVADFLEKNLGITIDHYISLGIDSVEAVVDALGGIEIDVAEDMIYTDPYQNLDIKIKKGRQVLDGKKAAQFVRYREGYIRGDLDRLDAQKLFLAALMKKLSEERNLFSVVEIIGAVLPYVETDISYADCFGLVKEMGVPDMNNVCFMTLPGGDVKGSSGAWYYVMNRAAAYRLIKERFSVGLSEENFDKERNFTSTVRSGFGEIYDAVHGYDTKIYSATEMNGG